MPDKFINPYTFVPIKAAFPDRRAKEEHDLTGCIECSLRVESSLFIPNTSKKFKYLKTNGKLVDKIKDFFRREEEEKNKKKTKKVDEGIIKENYEQNTNEVLKEHYFSEFFSYEDLSNNGDEIPLSPPQYPRIPGSEIRGVIRNVYEQLTNSCMSVIDGDNLPNMRSAKPKKAGLLDLESMKLYKAERVMLNSRKKYDNEKTGGKKVAQGVYNSGDAVYIVKSANTYKKYITDRNGNKKVIDTGTHLVDKIRMAGGSIAVRECKGYVVIGEYFSNKHHDSVILGEYDKTGKLDNFKCDITEADIERLENVMKKYNGKTVSDKLESLRGSAKMYRSYIDYYLTKKAAKKGILPVFYSTAETSSGSSIIYMSPAMITREYYSNTISDILERTNKHQCCDGKNGWCPACRLFGMVGKSGKNSDAIASRLRFTDSAPIIDCKFDPPCVLPILGSPRISASEFYLKKPIANDVCMWNYDYYTYNNNNGRMVYDSELAGRKVYWLGKCCLSDIRNVISIFNKGRLNVNGLTREVRTLKQRTGIRSLNKGNTTFKVYFEDLSKEELNCLIFCLTLGDYASNENTYHRIGKGKPFGMGAVKIDIKQIELNNYVINDGKIERKQETKESSEIDWDTYKLSNPEYDEAIKFIKFYSQKLPEEHGKEVRYPVGEDNRGRRTIYEWFVLNRGSIRSPKIEDTLPELNPDISIQDHKLNERIQN